MTAPLLESSVLAPRDPALIDSDEWPEFRLSDATVTIPGEAHNAPVSLLQACEQYPLAITGRLETVPKDLAHTFLLPSSKRSANIQIDEVRAFAYGAYEDESVDIWAAGGAGWFLIKPSKAYRAIYEEMIEAVRTLFFVADAYKTPRINASDNKSTMSPNYTLQELFEAYAKDFMGRPPKSGPEGAQNLYKHRNFLLASMIAGKEGLAWSRNPLYTHLRLKFAGDFAKVRQRLSGIAEATQKDQTPPDSRAAKQPSLESSLSPNSLKRKRGRPFKGSVDLSSVSPNSKIGVKANETPLHSPSTTIVPEARGESASLAPHRMRTAAGRSSALGISEGSKTKDSTNSSDDDSVVRRAHRGKSSLRLMPKKPMKGPPQASPVNQASTEDGDVEADEFGPSLPSEQRKRESELRGKRPTRSISKQQLDEGIDIPNSPFTDGEVSETPPDAAGGASQDMGDIDARQRDFAHITDPIQEDTWICALDGCPHKVYAASLPESQRLIREHYALHAYDDDARVQLVRQLQAPSLPVEHLMTKVRLQARLEGFPGSKVAGTRFPEPLKTRY